MQDTFRSKQERPEEIAILKQRIRDPEESASERECAMILQESKELYRSLFENMLNGFAYCKMYFDQGRPQDFVYLDVNDAFASLTGLKNVVGKKVSEVIPGIGESDTELFEIYGRVALTGKPEKFEKYVQALSMWFSISVYSPKKEHFVAIFDVITERKRAEEALIKSEETARRLAQENDLLAEVGRIISSTPNVDETYERFARKVREIIPFDSIQINIVNARDNTRTIQYHAGMVIDGRKTGDVVPLGGSVTEMIVRTRSGLLINEKDPEELLRQYPGISYAVTSGIQSRIGIPLISKDEVIGTLILRSVRPGAYTEDDLRLAERVGTQIAGTIANAQIYLELKQTEEALRKSEAKYYDLYENAPDMYYSLNLVTGAIEECNETFLRTTGYSREELMGRPIFDLYDGGSAEEEKNTFQLFQETGEVRDVERRVKCQDGRIIDVSLNVSALRDKDGNITYSRSIWHDITERKRQEETIRALSITDQLTGLYNRRGFTALAEQQLRIAERTRSGIVLLFADMDDLKLINDKLGHKAGDEAIAEVATVLKEVFRRMDIIARIGGDEFAVLALEASLEFSGMIKTRLQNLLAIRNSRAGRDYSLSLSIGMVYHDPSTTSSLDELLSRADSLMYEQKRRKTPSGFQS